MRCEWPKELGCSQVDGGLARQRDNRGHDLRRGLVVASFRFAASHVAPPAGPRADFLGWFGVRFLRSMTRFGISLPSEVASGPTSSWERGAGNGRPPGAAAH